MAGHRVVAKRIYDPASGDDGARVLVDRVWPRGVSKDEAHLDEWLKAIAPTTELRKWYGHDPDKYDDFQKKYRAELNDPDRAAALDRLREMLGDGSVTLLTASKALDISQAAVLVKILEGN